MTESTVAARDNPNRESLCLQMPDQRHHQRCFSGTARDDIANNDHWHAKALGPQQPVAVQRQTQAYGHTVDFRDRPEQARQPSAHEPGP